MTTDQDPLSTALSFDTHFEWPLDDEPEPTREPVYVDITSRDDERRPIIPAAYRGRNVRTTVRRGVGRNSHRAGFHGIRAPVYATKVAWYANVGAVRILGKSIRWWWVTEQHQLRQEAATANDPLTWLKLHADAKNTRRWRGIVLGSTAAGIVLLTCALLWIDQWWAWLVAAIPTAAFLAHHGRPLDKPILGTAVVIPRYRVLTADVVLRAYYAAKLGHPDKPDQQIHFGSTMARDKLNTGSEVVVDLPYGSTFADAVKAKANIASGLDVSEQQVYITRVKASTRSHTLFVADVDPLAIPAGKTALLACRPTDIWKPAPFGLDERGQRVTVEMLWNSILVGAQIRKGKTYSARLLALYGALDPYVKLTVVDGKNSPDWRQFGLVAHHIIFGTMPNRDGDPIEMLLSALLEIKQHIIDVNDFLSTLPVDQCPEGKLTRDLSRRYPQLRVWLLVLEEFQIYFELEDQSTNKEIASLLAYILAVGPSSGVILLSSTQKPSGVGAGDVQRLFNRYRDNHTVRFALKCGSRDVSMAILGGDAYGEGYDASALPAGKEYRGVGYLYGASDETPTVRCYLADREDADKILIAARKHREALGTLTGMAAGENTTLVRRDVLADVRSVFYAGEAFVSWQQIAGRLADMMPEAYTDLSAGAISAQTRDLGVSSVNGKVDGQVLKGAKIGDVDQAIARRQIGDGR